MFKIGICLFVIYITHTYAQYPQRVQIPGAVLVQPAPRQQSQSQFTSGFQPIPARVRSRPIIPNAIPIAVPVREVRPVIEEPEDNEQPNLKSRFDEEVARYGLGAFQSNVPQQIDDEPRQRARQNYKPERPLPVLREDIRDSPRPIPVFRPETPRPVIRQELKQEQLFSRPPASRQEYHQEEQAPVRRPQQEQVFSRPPALRQEYHQEEQAPVRRPQPAPRPAPQPAPVRSQPARAPTRPAPQYLHDEDENRTRKPTVQILRKYRTDNADGSITWGYENEDGSFKEENIGNDCITRGKYGYVDPDGVKREYTYETGGTCEEPDPEDLDDLPEKERVARPAAAAGGKKTYRPQQQVQYVN